MDHWSIVVTMVLSCGPKQHERGAFFCGITDHGYMWFVDAVID